MELSTSEIVLTCLFLVINGGLFVIFDHALFKK